jgi:hypothetical protein
MAVFRFIGWLTSRLISTAICTVFGIMAAGLVTSWIDGTPDGPSFFYVTTFTVGGLLLWVWAGRKRRRVRGPGGGVVFVHFIGRRGGLR